METFKYSHILDLYQNIRYSDFIQTSWYLLTFPCIYIKKSIRLHLRVVDYQINDKELYITSPKTINNARLHSLCPPTRNFEISRPIRRDIICLHPQVWNVRPRNHGNVVESTCAHHHPPRWTGPQNEEWDSSSFNMRAPLSPAKYHLHRRNRWQHVCVHR